VNILFQKSPSSAAAIRINTPIEARIIRNFFDACFFCLGSVVVVVGCGCGICCSAEADGVGVCWMIFGIVDTFWAAASISLGLYPALTKLCLAFVMFSPLDNAFCNPPINSCSRFGVCGATILGHLRRALSGIVCRVCIRVLLIIPPLVLFCRGHHDRV